MPEGDPAFGQIIGGNLNLNPVTRGDADEVLAHLSADVCKDFMSVLQLHLVHGCREDLIDDTVNLNEILVFFCWHNREFV